MDKLNLEHFTGTEHYHRIDFMNKTVGTDGIAYLMQNNYAWAITDALVIINKVLHKEEFISLQLSVDTKKETADMIYTDGNGNVLHKQHYKWTNVQEDISMYCTNGVLMLTSEY